MIADDFTGALDAGVQFAKKGFSTKVLVYSKDMSFQAEDADVLVVDAETRHKKPLEAYLTIFRIVKPAAESGVKYLFKKTVRSFFQTSGSVKFLLDTPFLLRIS